MKKPSHAIDIFLQPGEFYFGDRDTRIRTLLGSCVSITMWHPRKLIGGMCHYLLPSRNVEVAGLPDGRYAEDAIALFLKEIRAEGTRPAEYQVKLFGGGNMFLEANKRIKDDCRDVPCRNRSIARQLIHQHGFVIASEHMGGFGHRQIMFDVWSGNVWVKHTPPVALHRNNTETI